MKRTEKFLLRKSLWKPLSVCLFHGLSRYVSAPYKRLNY